MSINTIDQEAINQRITSGSMAAKADITEVRASTQVPSDKLDLKERGDDIRFKLEINKINNLKDYWDEL